MRILPWKIYKNKQPTKVFSTKHIFLYFFEKLLVQGSIVLRLIRNSFSQSLQNLVFEAAYPHECLAN